MAIRQAHGPTPAAMACIDLGMSQADLAAVQGASRSRSINFLHELIPASAICRDDTPVICNPQKRKPLPDRPTPAQIADRARPAAKLASGHAHVRLPELCLNEYWQANNSELATAQNIDEIFAGLNNVGTVHSVRFQPLNNHPRMISVNKGDFGD
jgi:hypothetical protein